MISSQKKLLQGKRQRKESVTELVSKNVEIPDKKLKAKRPKVCGEVKHVAESSARKSKDFLKKRKRVDKKTQERDENLVRNAKKIVEGKAAVLKVKSKKRNGNVKDAKSAEGVDSKRKVVESSAEVRKKERNSAKKGTLVASRRQGRMKRTSPVSQDFRTEQTLSEKFDVKKLSKKHILNCITAVFRLTQEQLKNENNLFAKEAQPIFMQVVCIKVPKVPRRCMRILLPHSIISSSDEVALFVCDLQRGSRKDYEPTVKHYKSLLEEHGCTRVNEIIPMNRVRTEYDQYELKKRLANSYDYFLGDGRIAGHLSHILGKVFYVKRKLPTSIRMQSKDLKHEIEHALRKTSMFLHSDGDSYVMQIGNTFMDSREILGNILAACKNLSKNYPGGWANIRCILLKSKTSLGLPIYMTLKSKNAVSLSVIPPRRPKAYRDVKGELSTYVSDNTVTVKPDGEVIFEKKSATGKRIITKRVTGEHATSKYVASKRARRSINQSDPESISEN